MIIRMKQFLYSFLMLCYCALTLYGGNEAFLNEDEQKYIAQKTALNVYVQPDIYYYSYTYENYLNGYGVQYLRMLAKKLGVELNFISDISLEEAKKSLAKGEIDIALFPYFESEDEGQFGFSTFPVGVLRPALLLPKIYQLAPKLDSIENLRIVTLKEDGFATLMRQKNPDAHIEVVDTIEEAVSKVMHQEVDLAIGLHEIFTAYLEYKMIPSLQSIPLQNNTDFPPVKMFLATSKESATMLSILNKTMAEIDYKQLVFARNRFFPLNTYRQTDIKVNLSEKEKFYLMGKQVLNVCTIPKNMPYGDIVNHRYEGLGAALLPLIEKNLDIPLQLILTHSAKESYEKLLQKKCDFIALATASESVHQSITFTPTLLHVPLVVVTKDNVLYVSDFNDIANRSFVIKNDHPMLEALLKAYPSLHVKRVASEIEGLKRVEAGEEYGMITSNFSVSYLFRNHVANDVKVSAQIPLDIPFSFALLKENETLFSILNKTSEEVLNQEIKKLVKKWVPERYPRGFDDVIILQLVLCFVLFSAISFWLYFEVKLKNRRLEETKQSLDSLNHELESRIKYEVEVSREKDMVMYRQSRFASMGEMIGNIAHQWRQPLMELSALLMDLQASIHFKAKVSQDEVVQTIVSSNRVIQFMSHTIDDFRNFFSPQKALSVFCINEVVNDAVTIMGATLKHHRIHLEVLTYVNDSMAYGLKNEYAQVIINLLSNAKDILISRAVPQGTIRIEIDETQEYSKVYVIDNAGGIADENLSQIFEPFFTKEKENGTGIGLFMSRMIIENNMNGHIRAGNVQNGASFCIMVPKPKQ